MLDEGLSRIIAQTWEDIDHSVGESTHLEDLPKFEGRQRSVLIWLENCSAPSCQDGGDLLGSHEEWIIPRDDLATDSDGLLQGKGEVICLRLQGLAVDLINPPGVILEDAAGELNLSQALGEWLTGVE